MRISVHINISLPEGLELVHYLEKYKSIIVIENELPGEAESIKFETYTVEEPGNILHDTSREHYKIDLENTINRDNFKTVSVRIDVSSEEGQELLRDLEKHPNVVVIDNLVEEGEDEIIQKTYSAEYAENLLWEKLNEHYSTDNLDNINQLILLEDDDLTLETYSAEEIEKMVWDKLNANYGVD